MRRLWIKRHKKFTGCAAKMKVYIEDPMEGDTTINGCLCRKLGVLKNGENKHFAIGDEAAKVFVISDKLSRNVYNEFYNVPAGREDVFLSGKNHYNPLAGNPFRFDGVTDEEVLKNRKKVGRKGLVVLVISLILGFFIGIGAAMLDSQPSIEPKTFSVDGMQITLTEDFSEEEFEGYTSCYGSPEVAVFVLEEEFTLMEGLEDLTVEEYGQLVLDNNGFDSSITLTDVDGLTIFEYIYTNPETGDDWYYLCSLHKGPDAFWGVEFATLEENSDGYVESFLEWADSVTFTVP